MYLSQILIISVIPKAVKINAGNIDKDYEWIKKQSESFDIEINNISNYVCQIAIQGPKAEEILSK